MSEKNQDKPDTPTNELNGQSIAIIGMSGEFPGAKSIQEFWNNLLTGQETTLSLTPSELTLSGIDNDLWTKANYVPRAGVLENIDTFAAAFFGYAPREASLMDPQQRKLLEHSWHACEDAAFNPLNYPGILGVWAGSSFNTYLLNNILSNPDIWESDDVQQILFGNGVDYLATRIAWQLNCRGPALNIQTACSTSLVAIHEACQQLLTYQVDAALVGGVSIQVPQKKGYLYSVDGIFSADGHCRPYSSEANGTLFSSGVAAVVLQRLEDALAEGRPIYAIIKGSAVNNDGHQKAGYTAPSINGQAEVIALAQAAAGISAADIDYIEGHGTGTNLGDPVELTALQSVFAEQTDKKQFCMLGSLKSNMGHLDIVSGLAGLIKTALTVHHQQIPPTLHCERPTLGFDWKNSAFKVNTSLENLDKNKTSTAAVSSFGIGGTNAHAILTSYRDPRPVLPTLPCKTLLCFSAKTATALELTLQQFAAFVRENLQKIWLPSVARTLVQGRVSFKYRAFLLVDDVNQVITLIDKKQYQNGMCEHDKGSFIAKEIELCNDNDLQHTGKHWLAGYTVDWENHYRNYQPVMTNLPLYPFEKGHYWIQPCARSALVREAGEYKNSEQSMMRLPLDKWFYQPGFKPAPCQDFSTPDKTGLTLLFYNNKNAFLLKPDFLQTFGEVIIIEASEKYDRLSEHHFQIQPAQLDHYERLFDTLKTHNKTPTRILHSLSLTTSRESTSVEVFKHHQQSGLLSILNLVQALEKFYPQIPLQLTVITNRLNRLAEALSEPHKAPILAAVKVIPKEFPTIQTQLIDVDFIDNPVFETWQLQALLREIAKSNYLEEEIVYRGTTRWVRTYMPIEVPAPTSPVIFSRKKLILIVGGLGQLGLNIAEYLAQMPGISLALISRKKMPEPEKWSSLRFEYLENHSKRILFERLVSLQQKGVNVQTFSVDISYQTNLQIAMEHIESSMGPIHGVIHAAGETINGIISLKNPQSLEESYQAKVYGSLHLCDYFVHKNLDFMILCSSMNAIIGGLGQLDNTAANTTIDYLAEYYSSISGKPFLSINWGAINMDRPLKANILPQFASLSEEHKRNRMNDAETEAIYARLLSNQFASRLVVSTLDMDDVLHNWNRVASLKELDKKLYAKPSTGNLDTIDLPETPMEIWMASQWSSLLGIKPLSNSAHFFDLGGHSLSAVQCMTRILEQYKVKIHVMTLYETPTLQAFSSHVENQLSLVAMD